MQRDRGSCPLVWVVRQGEIISDYWLVTWFIYIFFKIYIKVYRKKEQKKSTKNLWHPHWDCSILRTAIACEQHPVSLEPNRKEWILSFFCQVCRQTTCNSLWKFFFCQIILSAVEKKKQKKNKQTNWLGRYMIEDNMANGRYFNQRHGRASDFQWNMNNSRWIVCGVINRIKREW